MLKLNIETAKSLFFDREKVLAKLSKAEAFVFLTFGAIVRKSAQHSMRSGGKKNKRSKPGEPPRTHGDRLLRKHLFFAYDAASHDVVIGPALLNGSGKRNLGKTVPETLEYGGNVQVNEGEKRDGTWSMRAYAWAVANGSATRTREAYVAPRPYMRPAYEKAKPKLMDLWKDAMNKV